MDIYIYQGELTHRVGQVDVGGTGLDSYIKQGELTQGVGQVDVGETGLYRYIARRAYPWGWTDRRMRARAG